MKNLHLQFVLAFMAGWVNRSQQDMIEYLQAENQVYRELLGKKRFRLTDDQHRRLVVKAKKLGRKAQKIVAINIRLLYIYACKGWFNPFKLGTSYTRTMSINSTIISR